VRPVCSLMLAAALVFVSAQAVLAAKPGMEPLELPPSLELAAGEACQDFPLLVEFLANRGKTLTFFDNEGNAIQQIGTGTLKIRVTNLADESVAPLQLNISGPIHIALHPDGSATLVFGGRGISLFPPGPSCSPQVARWSNLTPRARSSPSRTWASRRTSAWRSPDSPLISASTNSGRIRCQARQRLRPSC
jgi:hypothetical protein